MAITPRRKKTTPTKPSKSAPKKTLRIYLAAPLFTILERRANRSLGKALAQQMPEAKLLLPQDFKHDNKYNDQRAFHLLFKGCIKGIDSSDVMLAWMDGPDADSGTCFEVGYAYAKKIPVVGIRTDFRLNQERGLNVMLSRACKAFVYRPSFDEDVSGLAKDIVKAIRKATRNGKA